MLCKRALQIVNRTKKIASGEIIPIMFNEESAQWFTQTRQIWSGVMRVKQHLVELLCHFFI